MDHMPCTENVDANALNVARQILERNVPPGYRMTDFFPNTRTGRNPHRWVCIYERNDGVYSQTCDYLTTARTVLKKKIAQLGLKLAK